MLNLVETFTPLEIYPDVYIIAGTPFLYLSDLETIICGDLHIGELAHITNRGISNPIFKDDTLQPAIDALNQIDKIVDFKCIIFNGDIKHQTHGINQIEQGQLAEFFRNPIFQNKECVLIRGNHDVFLGFGSNLLPTNCKIEDFIRSERYLVHHGHELIEDISSEIVILSHEHPAFQMRGNNYENIRVPSFVSLKTSTNQFAIILPSASALPSGVPFPPKTKNRFMSPYLRKYAKLDSLTLYPFDVSVGSFIYSNV